MIKSKKPLTLFLCVLLSAIVFCGCSKKIELSSGSYPDDSTQLSAVMTAEDLLLLDGFYQLQSADFSGSICYDEIIAWKQNHPGVDVKYTLALPDGQSVLPSVETLDLSQMDGKQFADFFDMLKYLPSVQSFSLPAHVDLEQINALAALYPNAKLNFSATVSGIEISPATTQLNFSSKTSADVQAVLPWISLIPELEKVDFGEENGKISWDDIYAVHLACPNATLDYSFELYGKYFTLADKSMDLNHIAIDDNGVLVKQITACMSNLEYLDMDSCGVSDEAMAEIRDSLPNTKVVWRIWFGEKYSVRTDVEKILASNPGVGGELTAENTVSLKYCTDVKYLDVGHNSYLSDVSFVAYMPKLEVAILAMADWSDISGLANCPNLEYAEIQTSALNDVSPLAGLTNLKHLNISYCLSLTDITPLYNLTQLERLWIGCLTPIHSDQVEKFKELAPQCEVNTTTLDPTEGGWRFTRDGGFLIPSERYNLLRQQFEYELATGAYSYYFNDPLY